MARAHHGAIRVAAALALALATPAAWASESGDSDADARERAQTLLGEGDEYLERGDAASERGDDDAAQEAYETALEAYERAFDAFPEARIYYPIGRAQEKLGEYSEAHARYGRVLEEGEAISDRLRAELESRQEAVRARIAGVTLDVDPEDVEVFVDGEPVGRGPLEEPIYVDPGAYHFEIEAEGYATREFELEAEEGASYDLFVALGSVPDLDAFDDDELVAAADVQLDEGTSPPSRAPLAAGLSVTAGLGLAATATGLAAVSQHGTFTDETRPADERQSARDTGEILAVTTDVLLIATAAAAGYTAYYYFGEYRPRLDRAERKEEASARSLWLRPYAGGEGGGVALGGRF